MATTLQLRRGTTAEANAFTGAEGEIFVDTTLNQVRIHDGATQGGFVVGEDDLAINNRMEVANTQALFSNATANLNSYIANTEPRIAFLDSNGEASSSLIPASNNLIDLGSPGRVWRDVYIGPGSLFVNGKKVIEDNSDTITITTSENQNLKVQTSGSGVNQIESGAGGIALSTGTSSAGDITINADGNIELLSTVQIQSGKRITDSAGTKVEYGDAIEMNGNKIIGLATPTAGTDAATKDYVDGAGGITQVAYSSANGNFRIQTNDGVTHDATISTNDKMEVANTITLVNARLGATSTVALTGDVTASATAFSSNSVSIATTIANDSVDGDKLTDSITLAGDLTVSGGDITLGGTGRIQGIDTVSVGTDAANKTYVDNEIANLVDSAPATLDTLNELAAALGDDPNFATTVSTNIGQKLGATASVTLTGDVSGSASFSANAVSITTTVADDSHNHIISNVDGLQDALNNRMTVANTQALVNARLGATASVALTGDITGSASFSGNSVSISTTYNNDVVLGTDTSGNYVATITGGTGLTSTGATSGEGIAHSLSVDYGTSAGTACQGNDARLSDSRTCDNTFDDAATARSNLGLGSLATLSSVNASTITDNSVGAAELNVSGNGSAGQYLESDGDGSFTWSTVSGYTDSDVDAHLSGGAGISYSSGTISVDSDLRGDVTQIGQDTNDYYSITTTQHRWFLDGAEDMRLTNNGQLDVEGNVVAHSSTISDINLKENIEKIDNALDKVKQLSGYTFEYKKDGRKGAGIIAQEVEKVLPSAVSETEILGHDGSHKIVEYDQLHGLLIESIKTQQEQIESLKKEIDELKKSL